MKSNPLVSIIIPTFNRENFIRETILSVVNQIYANWELIIVDDGSTDNTINIINEFTIQNSRIKLYQRTTPLKGGSVCRNIGAKNAKGEYLIFLDSDDLLADFCIEQRIKYMSKFPNDDFQIFPMLLFKKKVNDLMILQNIPTSEKDLDRFIRRENVWLMSSPIWKKEYFIRLNGFNEHYLSYQDWELNIRALLMGGNYHFFGDALPDNYYRQHSSTLSSNRYTEQHSESNIQMILDVVIELKSANKFDNIKRNSLVYFYVSVLNRFRNSHAPFKEINKKYINFLLLAREVNLLNEKESKIIHNYLKWHHHKFAYKFTWFRRLLDNYFLNKKLKLLNKLNSSNQTKHIYNGKVEFF